MSTVQYEFSTDKVNWHPTMQTNDKYRRDSLDGGTTWGEPYQFVGMDGANGSDATVPAYITKTKITSTTIESPTIVGGLIRGGKIESDSTINVTTDAKVGGKLTVNADNFGNGVDFRHKDGSLVAEVYVDPATEYLFLSAPHGKVMINGHEYSPYAILA